MRVSLELVDADGCLYHHEYVMTLMNILVEHYDFFTHYRDINLQQRETYEKFTTARTELYAQIDAKIKLRRAQFANQLQPSLRHPNLIELAKCHHSFKLQAQFLNHEMSEDKCNEIKALIHETLATISTKDVVREFAADIISVIYTIAPAIMTKLMLAYNEELMASIIARQHEFDELVFLVGSQRQSYDLDEAGIGNNCTGSIFTDLPNLAQHVQQRLPDKKVRFANVLMPDLFHDLTEGMTYSHALLAKKYDDVKHFAHCYDETKLSILYGLIHSQVWYRKNDQFTVHCYDDRCGEYYCPVEKKFSEDYDILETLHFTLQRYPDLFPRGMPIMLHPYQGKLQPAMLSVGTGDIDRCYQQNVNLMLAMINKNNPPTVRENCIYDVARELDIAAFLKCRTLTKQSVNIVSLFAEVKKERQNETVISAAMP